MEFTKRAHSAIRNAYEYAKTQRYEYVTPETMLLFLVQDEWVRACLVDAEVDIQRLTRNLQRFHEQHLDHIQTGDPVLSASGQAVIESAGFYVQSSGRTAIDIPHLLHAVFHLPESDATYYLGLEGIEESDLLARLAESDPEQGPLNPMGQFRTNKAQGDAAWRQYAPCLNETLKDVNPLIGREAEMERMMQVLSRRDKNNPLLIGEPGVGKTAIVYGLVMRLQSRDVPETLVGCKVFALDLGSLVAGTQYRGEFEKRLKTVLAEIAREEKPIIFIDEIHNLSGTGAVGESSLDASNMLKPYLAEGHIRFVGATTFEEYKKSFEKNKSLVRRFQNIEVTEPGEEESIRILEGLKARYEAFHGVQYAEETLAYAVHMSAKHMQERFLPDKAIDLMDEAGAYRKLHPLEGKVQTVDQDVFAQVLTKICRVPLESVASEEVSTLQSLEGRMKAQVFGQDEAIDLVVNAIKFSRAGLLEDEKPLASLLFVGPTGVGKTEVARVLARELGVKLVRFDMSEYAEKHTVAKLIGAPAGYVGYEEGGLMTEEIRKHPSCVLLLDEIEKAHADIYQVLLQVMDYATLTDNQGRKADFRNVVIIMTSNAGANRIGKAGIGFEREVASRHVLMEEVKRTFQPEFRNRLNRIVMFRSMDADMARKVVDKKLMELSEMLLKKQIELHVDAQACDAILARGVSQEFGAREIDRVIRNEIKPLFVDEILFGTLKDGGKLTLTYAQDRFHVQAEA